jgi:hypothetical protein
MEIAFFDAGPKVATFMFSHNDVFRMSNHEGTVLVTEVQVQCIRTRLHAFLLHLFWQNAACVHWLFTLCSWRGAGERGHWPGLFLIARVACSATAY